MSIKPLRRELDSGKTREGYHEKSSFERYARDALQEPLLTKEEEIALGIKAMTGRGKTREEARRRMYMANLRLVVRIAGNFSGYGVPLLDLIQEGNIGLGKAVENFDPRKGKKLCNYVAWYIKNYVKRANRTQNSGLRRPEGKNLCVSSLEQEEEGFSLLDRQESGEPGPNQAAMQKDLHRNLYHTISTLPGRERRMLELVYRLNGYEGRKETIAQIARREFGVSRTIIERTMRKSVMPKLRKSLREFEQ